MTVPAFCPCRRAEVPVLEPEVAIVVAAGEGLGRPCEGLIDGKQREGLIDGKQQHLPVSCRTRG